MSRHFSEAVLRKHDAEAFTVLGLTEDPASYTVEQVDAVWRKLRSELHPDKGGNAAGFDQARKAYEAARFYALEPKPCPDCGGRGKVNRHAGTGFGDGPLVNCKTCKGSGQR